MEGPQGGLDGLDDVAAALDFGRLPALEAAVRDILDFTVPRPQLVPLPCGGVFRVQEVGLADTVDRGPYKPAVVAAGVDTGAGAVGRARALARVVDGFGGVAGEEHGSGRQAHYRAVAGAALVRRAGVRLAGTLEPVERGAGGVADVEAMAGAAPKALAAPAGVSLDLIFGIESLTLNETVGETERQRRVVGPLARGEAERPAAGHVGDWLEHAGLSEFQSRTEGVSDGESDKRAAEAVGGQVGWIT